MQEDINYKLITGKRWMPFGRKYQTLKPITHYSGLTIPTGFIWDGGTGVPLKFNDTAAYAFLCHDYDFGGGNTNVLKANSECVKHLYNESSLILALLIAVWFAILTPTLHAYFYAETTVNYRKLARLFAHTINALNFSAILWVLWEIFG